FNVVRPIAVAVEGIGERVVLPGRVGGGDADRDDLPLGDRPAGRDVHDLRGNVADLHDDLSRVTQGRLRHADLDPDGILAVRGVAAAGQAIAGAGLVDRVALARHRVAVASRAVEGVAESAADGTGCNDDDWHWPAFGTAGRDVGDQLWWHGGLNFDGADVAAGVGARRAALIGVGRRAAIGVVNGGRAVRRQHRVGGAAVVPERAKVDGGHDIAGKGEAA